VNDPSQCRQNQMSLTPLNSGCSARPALSGTVERLGQSDAIRA
jgi:hypothetical protein